LQLGRRRRMAGRGRFLPEMGRQVEPRRRLKCFHGPLPSPVFLSRGEHDDFC